jgi:coenzyme PQQ precursor peptide PqqA
MHLAVRGPVRVSADQPLGQIMLWTKPEFEDLRFGFEITMYVATR